MPWELSGQKKKKKNKNNKSKSKRRRKKKSVPTSLYSPRWPHLQILQVWREKGGKRKRRERKKVKEEWERKKKKEQQTKKHQEKKTYRCQHQTSRPPVHRRWYPQSPGRWRTNRCLHRLAWTLEINNNNKNNQKEGFFASMETEKEKKKKKKKRKRKKGREKEKKEVVQVCSVARFSVSITLAKWDKWYGLNFWKASTCFRRSQTMSRSAGTRSLVLQNEKEKIFKKIQEIN